MNVERIAVIGAGTMGAGIAQVAAAHGCAVRLIEVNADVLDKAFDAIQARFDRAVEKGRMTDSERDAAVDRIVGLTEITDLSEVQLAIEAVVEDLDVKTAVFKSLEQAAQDAVLATNTSSLRVSKIASAVNHPGRVIGMHFFNPAPIMPLVEIIAAEQSDESSLELATNVAKDWDKVPVRAKDTPGFIVNRVARGFYLEALRMLGEGAAAVHTIDNAMRALGKFRMGPFQLMDLVGLDVNYAVSCSVWEQSGKPPRLKPHNIQRDLVEEGRLGRKSKRGFYRYESDPPVVNVEIDVQPFTPPAELEEAVKRFTDNAALCDEPTLNGATDVERYAFARILATIMNEAAMALDEEVATASDIDTAMRYGTNYPQGPCEWADKSGRDQVAALLNALNEATGDTRFTPSKAL